MRKAPNLKMVRTDAPPAATPATERDPRTLTPLDWITLALVALAVLIASLWAGTFATPPASAAIPPQEDLSTFLESLGLPLVALLTAAAFAVMAWREWQRPVAIGSVPGAAVAFSLMALWAALTLLRSHALYMSLTALATLFAVLLLGGISARLARDRLGLAALLGTVALAGSLVAGYGIHEYLIFFMMRSTLHRTFATFANPDFLAGYLLLTLPLTLAFFAATQERMARVALGVGLALQSGCLMLTGSRAGVGLLLITLLVWLALAFFSGSAARQWKRIGLGLAVFVVAGLLASAPTLYRFTGIRNSSSRNTQTSDAAMSGVEAAAATQSYSVQFRRWTWIGTLRSIQANPLIGTGLGTFEVAYPHYAETAYTAHAHNSYLQWASDTGVPGLLFLLTGLAAATAFGAYVLRLQRAWRRESGADEKDSPPAPAANDRTAQGMDAERLLGDRSLLLAGLLAAILASMLHSLFDSDWFIVATAITLSVTVALMIGLARDLAPLATQTPRPLGWELTAIGLLAALFMLWRGAAIGLERADMAAARQGESAGEVLSAYRAAAAADPFDPEPHLWQAIVYHGLQRPDDELRELKAAVGAAQTGKTLYRLGQYYAASGDTAASIDAFERARYLEPRNVQNLNALAKALRVAGKPDQAAAVYQAMASLEHSPYGEIRAVPELVETDFANAHAGLADIAAQAGRWADAAAEYERADAVLRLYWSRRNLDINLQRPEEKRKELAQLYDTVLTHWQEALQKLGKTQEAAAVAAEQAQFHKDQEDDRAAAQKAANQDSAAP